MECPSQTRAHRAAKFAGASDLYKDCNEEPSCAQNLFGTSTNTRHLPLDVGFLRPGETHSEFNYRNNCYGRDFDGVITPEHGHPGF